MNIKRNVVSGEYYRGEMEGRNNRCFFIPEQQKLLGSYCALKEGFMK